MLTEGVWLQVRSNEALPRFFELTTQTSPQRTLSVARLSKLANLTHPSGKTAPQLKRVKDGNNLLLDVLVPRKNCNGPQRLVSRLTQRISAGGTFFQSTN
jgi:hypothetical protein